VTRKMAGRQHILLAEDNPLDVQLTLDAFAQNRFPHEITVVRDGEQALDYLYRREKFQTRPTWNPAFVLLDNKMPKVTGLEVVKIIKADENLNSIPIVALTSSLEPPDLKEFYKHGVNAYVVKPVDFSELVKVVKQIGIFWTEINESPPNTG
jgi:CheY-like chemotaxis protein